MTGINGILVHPVAQARAQAGSRGAVCHGEGAGAFDAGEWG